MKRLLPYLPSLRGSSLAWLMFLLLLLGATARSYALPTSHYASSSKMSSGKWVKIKVTSSGMHILTNTFLKNLGFSDPKKVHVFGYGGRLISEVLDETQVDDLPLAPQTLTDKGILFFGYDINQWSLSDANGMTYTHQANPYSKESYYFISDCELENGEMETRQSENTPGTVVSTFIQRRLHESHLSVPSNTGAIVLGEDFRTQTTRTFNLDCSDNATGKGTLNVRFGTAQTNGSSSLLISANGQLLPSTTSDNIPMLSNSDQFLRLVSTIKEVPLSGNQLPLEIKFQQNGGVLNIARLDYIELNYEANLKMDNSGLYFFYSASNPVKFQIADCGANTQVWDITDPAAPFNIPLELSGSDGEFVSVEKGYREYVAFNTNGSFPSPTGMGTVQNQDIHAMDVPNLLIISPKQYLSSAENLAAMHREHDGMRVHVLTPDVIYNEFSSGTPDITAFRKCLKMWYDRGKEGESDTQLQHVLIYSRPTYDHYAVGDPVKKAGYPRVPIWQSISGTSQTTSYSTDSYIAMLEDNPNNVFRIEDSQLSIGVGRLPVKSVTEAEEATDKIINYTLSPIQGSWRNKALLVADDQDNNVHLDQSQKVYNRMKKSDIGADLEYERLYIDAYPLEATGGGATYVIPNKLLKQSINDGVLFVNYIGHASPREWGHESLLTWTDIKNFNNRKLPFFYTATCEFTRWDDDNVSGGEELWLYPNSGAIALLSTSRTVYITPNEYVSNAMSENVFCKGADGKAKRIGDIFKETMNGVGRADDNKLRYILVGDPAMRLPVSDLEVVIDEIKGVEMATVESADDYPELAAKGRVLVKGHIADNDGNLLDGFNGTIETTLYDGETVVETLGNGEKGEPTMYNDRLTRLFFGKTQVKDGKWESLVLMPAEISNNRTEARMTLYAYSDEGKQANGSTEKIFVYGYEPGDSDDNEGPEISSFYINHEAFSSNDIIGSDAMIYAKVSDPSGINISEGGIGHAMSLVLDGKTYYSDVSAYYNPDATDPYTGELQYLISDLEPGDHTLDLIVWDNANNSTTERIDFRVSVTARPGMINLTTDVNPASTSVNFIISHDRPGSALSVSVDVYSLNGDLVWSTTKKALAGNLESDIAIPWDLCDSNGRRVARSIYLYRATIEDANGRRSSETKKLAVTAQ